MPPGVPSATVSIGILSLRCLARDGCHIDAGVRGAVGQQHDRRRRMFRVRAAEQLERELERVAGVGRAVGALAVDDRPRGVWLALGACTASGELEKATAPTSACAGSWSMNVLAARSAAASRVGSTSVAAIEPEWSVTSITDAWSTGAL